MASDAMILRGAYFKSPSNFLTTLPEMLDQKGLDQTLQSLRASGVLLTKINPRRSKTLKSAFSILSKASSRRHKKAVKRLDDELSVLERLFQSISDLRRDLNIEEIPAHYRISAYLISLEVLLSILMMINDNVPINRILEIFPLTDKSISCESLTKPSGSRFERNLQFEMLVEAASIVIKFLYREMSNVAIDTEPPIHFVETASLYNLTASTERVAERQVHLSTRQTH